MKIIDSIKNWRLKRKIPTNQKNGGKFRYAPNGIDKIFVDIDEEVETYNLARKRQKEKDELGLWEKS